MRYMFLHYAYQTFKNESKYNYEPLLRYNWVIMYIFYKYCVQCDVRMNAYDKALRMLPSRPIYSLKHLSHLSGIRQIQEATWIMRTRKNLSFVEDLGFRTPDFSKKVEKSNLIRYIESTFATQYQLYPSKKRYLTDMRNELNIIMNVSFDL